MHSIILVYEGEFTQEITKSVLAMAERNMESMGEESGIKRKVFNVMVECLQNIVKHSDEYVAEQMPINTAIFMIGKHKDSYIITSGNPIKNDDIDILKEPEKLRETLGYLPQDFGVYPRVSAYDMLDHMAVLKGVANSGERKDTVETLLAQTNLWDVRKKAIAGFSGGMRQRFGIAQALIGNPQLIIVDEPTAGLDPEERNRFLNLLAEIGENVVVILSTHIVEDVSDLCPQMAVIVLGQIKQQGAPKDLIEQAKGTVWAKTIDRAELDNVREKYNVISTRLFAGKTIVHVLSDSDPNDGFASVEGGLEDVYFSTLAKSRREAAPQSQAA